MVKILNLKGALYRILFSMSFSNIYLLKNISVFSDIVLSKCIRTISAVIVFSFFMLSVSCDDNEELHNVVYEVECDMVDVPVRLYGIRGSVGLVVENYWKHSVDVPAKNDFKNDPFVGIKAKCYEEQALITLRIFVDGKLKIEKTGNSHVEPELINLLNLE